MARRLTHPITRAATATASGYRSAPGPEQVAFVMSSSAALTIAGSRTLNYVRERRRAMPRVRNLGRLVAAVPVSNAVRVHHFLPGMAIGFAVAATSLFARGGRMERWLSLPFGVGLALTTDELPLLYGRTNPYWGDNAEHFALAQGAAATLASLGLGLRFLRRGWNANPASPAALEPRPDLAVPPRDVAPADNQP